MKAFFIGATLVLAVVATAAQQAPPGLVNPDTASAGQMGALPHMTPALAQEVIAKRPYKTMLDVDAVLSPRLSAQQRTELYGRLFKPVDLNTATRPEMLLIPGLGNRMVREFEEYRPYTSMAQFRREIGKYVDQKEVARLEQYVAIR